VSTAIRTLPASDQNLLSKIREWATAQPGSIVPTPERPIGMDNPLARLVVTLQVHDLKHLPPEKVQPHPAAKFFPGDVPKEAKRVKKVIEIDTSIPDWHSTGLYAAPGEVLTIRVPKEAAGKGLAVRIGAHSDTLWHLPTWRRCPEICRTFLIDKPEVKVANAFGGLVYLVVPRGCRLGKVQVEVDGAVEAPYFVLGRTPIDDWVQRIRYLPAPWAELATSKIVADIQISAGYMHSGYPIMTHLDAAKVMVDVTCLMTNSHGAVWGLFHELGHNHQSPDWTFEGTGEVTVNLFTLYVLDKVCRIPPERTRKELSKDGRAEALRRFFASGAKFEVWKSDPFLALIMYVQIQEAFGWDAFRKVFAEYRQLSPNERPKNDDEKRDQWLIRLSRTVGRNLAHFFDTWGIPVSEQAKQAVADLPEWMPENFPPK
jgi:hypothetical protein